MTIQSSHNPTFCKEILVELKSIKSYLEQVRSENILSNETDHPIQAARKSGIHEGVDIALDRISYLVGYVGGEIDLIEGGEPW